MRPRSNMKLNPEDLAKITDLTLRHYNEQAEYFWQGTRDHNVSQNITALLQSIDGEPPYTLLDFGCGPGRDLKVFAELGHIAVGLDGAPHFAMWRVHIVAAKYGSRIFLSSICRIAISMAYSPTQHCFTYPARSYRVCC
jgi:SAM-dependent methyltransferase